MGDDSRSILERYFALLDARKSDELVEMFAESGCMITRGGTGGEPVRGRPALGAFYAGRGPAVSRHVITNVVQSPAICMAEGVVKPLAEGETKYFIASATVDDDGLITRYTTLVWNELTEEQERNLVASR